MESHVFFWFIPVSVASCRFTRGITRKRWWYYPSCISIFVQICSYQIRWRYYTTVDAFNSWIQQPHLQVVVLPLQKRRQGHDLVYQKWIRYGPISRRWYSSQFCYCSLDDIEERSFSRRRRCCLVCHCTRIRDLAHNRSIVNPLLTRRLTSWTAKRLSNFQVGSSFTKREDYQNGLKLNLPTYRLSRHR